MFLQISWMILAGLKFQGFLMGPCQVLLFDGFCDVTHRSAMERPVLSSAQSVLVLPVLSASKSSSNPSSGIGRKLLASSPLSTGK